jgi:hypothetical protein
MSEPALAQLMIERRQGGTLGSLDRTTIGTFRNGDELLEVGRLRGVPGVRYPANRGPKLVEVQPRHLARLGGRAAGRDLGLIQSPELAELGISGEILVLSAQVVELRREHEVRVGAFEPDEPRELTRRCVADEIELAPQLVELAPAGVVEEQIVERTVIAEVPHRAVETGAEQASCLALGQPRRRPFGHEERVGNDVAELFQRRDGSSPRRRIRWHDEVGVISLGCRIRRTRGDQHLRVEQPSMRDLLPVDVHRRDLRCDVQRPGPRHLECPGQLLPVADNVVAKCPAGSAHGLCVRTGGSGW